MTFVGHHKSHAVSALQTSPFAGLTLSVVLDGRGEEDAISIWLGDGGKLMKLKSIVHPNSLGGLYRVTTKFLGFTKREEGKLMGLAPYGYPGIKKNMREFKK